MEDLVKRIEFFLKGLTDGKVIVLILFTGVVTGIVGALQWMFTAYFYNLSMDFLMQEDIHPGRLSETSAFVTTVIYAITSSVFIHLPDGKLRDYTVLTARLTLVPTVIFIVPGFMVWIDLASAMSVSITMAIIIFICYVSMGITQASIKND